MPFQALQNNNISLSQKSNKRLMAETITGEIKSGGQRRAKRLTACRIHKEGRELASLAIGSYLTHGPFNIACMQIVIFNSNETFRISITCQYNLPLYSRG
jgi:hypothetical protein